MVRPQRESNTTVARPETSRENARSSAEQGDPAIVDVLSPETIQDTSGPQIPETDDPLDVLRAALGGDDQGAKVIRGRFPARTRTG